LLSVSQTPRLSAKLSTPWWMVTASCARPLLLNFPDTA
jgi:hypothetical protein